MIPLGAVIAVVIGISVAGSAAAAPYAVTYSGTPVTTAVPGKPFTLKFQVKNTGDTTYSGVKVIFHVPEEFINGSVSPGDAVIEDGTISWVNLAQAGGKSFYPSFSFTVDSGTPLKKKLPVWVEVMGTGMEATSTNFSVTTRAASAAKTASTLSSTDISTLFQLVYGRIPTTRELKYWLGRRPDKPQRTALLGAMTYHKDRSITH